MKSAQNLLCKTLNSFRALDLSHKLFLFVILFNILAWSDVFEPTQPKIAANIESAKLFCANAQWDTRDERDEYFAVSRVNIVGTQSSAHNQTLKIKKLDSVVVDSSKRDFLFVVSKTQYFVFKFPHNNNLRGFSLRGPPQIRV